MSDLSNKNLTRRAVLKATGAAGATLGFPTILPSTRIQVVSLLPPHHPMAQMAKLMAFPVTDHSMPMIYCPPAMDAMN